jgi:hypothetical protein
MIQRSQNSEQSKLNQNNEQTIEMQNKNKNKEWQKYSLLSNNDMKN